ALHRFNGQYHLRAWLHRILSNVCHDESSRRQREMRLVERAGSAAVADEEITDVAGDEMLDRLAIPRRDVIEALTALPEPYRRAVVLRYVDELSFQEVAAATGVTEGNARARVHRARAVLRQTLTSSVAAITWLVVLLRRAERTVVPDAGGPTVQASLAASHSSPVLARVVDSGLVERAASLAGSIGVAASLAVPVGVSHVADRVHHPAPPAVVAVDDVAGTDDAPNAPTPTPGPSEDSTTRVAVSPNMVDSRASAGTATTAATRAAVDDDGTESVDGATSPTTVPATEHAEETPSEGGLAPGPGGSTPPPAAADPVRSFLLESADLTATRSWRTDLSGIVTVTIGDQKIGGNLSGVLQSEGDESGPSGRSDAAESGDAAADTSEGADSTSTSAAAGRPFTAELSLRLDDGRVVRVLLSGTLTDQPDGSAQTAGSGRVVDDLCGVELGTVDVGGTMHIRDAPLASSISLSLDGVALDQAARSSDACAA
ncbi:MAG: sigma-70 family RNA polymerase sigma factor, partial [Actinomycetota bacterium]